MLHTSRMTLATLFILIVQLPFTQAQDDKVYKGLTADDAAKLLSEFKVDFKKASSKKGDEHYFEFTRNKYPIRLTHFSKDEILLDCVFHGASMERVNQWNTFTRVTRATYHKDNTGEFTILEYGLDLTGGVTAGAFKQYIARFDEELKRYDKFIGNASDDVVLAEVTNDKLENIFKTQGIDYKAKPNKDGVMMFDFELGGHKLRMYNFGGKDLMIDVHFKKIALEEVNRYNLNRKFVRVVNYRGKDAEYTALEANLDCTAGVSEGMIRHWIVSFGEDARHFGDHAKKLTDGEKK